MVLRNTDGRFDAVFALGARIYAFLVDARSIGWTVAIALASNQGTGYLRITYETWRTFANGAVLDSVAFGAGAAGGSVWCASWHAETVSADVLTGAVTVASTVGCEDRKKK